MMSMPLKLSEERLSKIMAKRLDAGIAPPDIPPQIIALHDAGYLPSQIAHRLALSRVDVNRFVKRLPPIACNRFIS